MKLKDKAKPKDHGDWQVRIMHALDYLAISWQAACRLYGRKAGLQEPYPSLAAFLSDEAGERMAEILSGQVHHDHFSLSGHQGGRN